MALVSFTGFETGAAAGDELNAITGTASFDTSTVRTGTYSLRTNPTTTATGYGSFSPAGATGAFAFGSVVDSYFTFYFRYATIPSSNKEQILYLRNSGNTTKASIRINSSGQLGVYDSTNTVIATGSTVLSSGTWYRIDFYLGTGTSGSYSLAINDVSELSGTGNFTTSNTGRIYFGKFANSNSQTVDFYYDDFWWDDAAFVADGSFKVLSSSPIGAGSTQAWTDGTTGTYADIDENPYSDTDYVMSPTTGNPNVGLFTFNTCSTMGLGASDTVKAVKITGRRHENTSVTSSNFVRIRSGSTNSDSSTLNLSTSIVAFGRSLETDPNTSAAWTQSGVNAVEGGLVENNAVAVRMTYLRLQVAYIESAGAVDLVIQDATSASAEDNSVLTQLHILTIQDSSSSSTEDNAALTQLHILTMQNVSSASSEDNLALTQLHILSIQDSTSSSTEDGLALTQYHLLGIQDLSSSDNIDNLTFEISYQLIIEDIGANSTIENIALIQSHMLNIYDMQSASRIAFVIERFIKHNRRRARCRS